MITAWPTTSPVNVSATSTPLYYYTAYPSVGSNETSGGLLGLAASLTSGVSTTAIILGSVALGIVGIGAVGGAVAYFRGGGTVGGFMKKVEESKGAMSQFANALPISAADKAKLTAAIADPTSLLPPEAQGAVEKAQAKAAELQAQAQGAFEKAKAQAETLQAQAAAMNQSVLHALPPQLSSVIQAKQDEFKAQSTAMLQAKKEELQSQVQAVLPPQVVSLIQSQPQAVQQPQDAVISFEPTPVAAAEAIAEVTAEVTHVAIKSEDLEAVKAFLAAKNVTT